MSILSFVCKVTLFLIVGVCLAPESVLEFDITV